MKKKYLYLYLFLLFCLSCSQPYSTLPTGNPKGVFLDKWLIFGQIAGEDFKNGQIMAIGPDGSKFKTDFDENNRFGLLLPGLNTYAIYFLPKKNSIKEKYILTFEDSPDIGINKTLRLPIAYNGSYLNLGQIDINNGEAFSSQNPSNSLDFDQDGQVDYKDLDDQNNNIEDLSEKSNLEQILICHLQEDKEMLPLIIDLTSLLDHLDHGDFVGDCLKK